MLNDQLDGITPFMAVAELKSFTEAAARLGVTPTAVSKAIRVLEHRYGVVLFQRTTRRVALTEAGDSLYRQMRPAVADMLSAIETLEHYRHRPQGTLRVTAPRNNTADYLFNAIVPRFRQAYPEVMLDISLDDGLVDIVAEGFDAGIRLGESVEGDMVAVRLTPEISWSVAATPEYFIRAGRPVIPEDLLRHEAIRYRFVTSRIVHRWEFRSGRRDFVVDVKGGIIVNDRNLLIEFALQGLGLAFVSDYEVRHHYAAGRLESVLREYIPSDSGVFLYFPQRSQTQPKLRAFIDMAKEVASQPGFLDRFRE
ncbi:LysR family transcriptional regulator [Sodalis ligni]|uniref:LysR family transcriptional regulator n=1 Tax=Sodalis TaxID=84565 RepID=UPI00193EE397|nr:LysR family transcriptional regulator [Sodalis ligni]QWA11299.1 LysR family transcriptional regulator [Sodalis ligni]